MEVTLSTSISLTGNGFFSPVSGWRAQYREVSWSGFGSLRRSHSKQGSRRSATGSCSSQKFFHSGIGGTVSICCPQVKSVVYFRNGLPAVPSALILLAAAGGREHSASKAITVPLLCALTTILDTSLRQVIR